MVDEHWGYGPGGTDPAVLTDEELADMEAMVEEATHVSAERVRWDASGPVVGYYHGGRWFSIAECRSWEGDDTDIAVAEFIAHARTDVPRLIAALRASRAELAALSWATREYDEDTGYCLCGCCRHGI